MSKILFQFAVMAGLFAAVFFSLSRIDFTGAAEIDKLSSESSRKLGDLMLKAMLSNKEEITQGKAPAVLDSIKNKLCLAAGMDADSVQLHLVEDSDVNAFAMPGNHMVVFTGLVNFSKNPEEVAGVMGHELGHLKLAHLEKKLIKEVGLTMLFTIISGQGGGEVIREVVKMISSTAFDREYETEADVFAVETLAKAGADPGQLGNFMFRVSQQQNLPEELVFLSTHPDSKKRSADILKRARKVKIERKPLVNSDWEQIRTELGGKPHSAE